ncbi:hypothetical protein [Phytoactinopolyspora halophila]|uniref:hypothetical protein n=1 Tax=Phytoactinopolyspora halophila TaxID=1981511 RepID=UPI000F4F1DE6|nr:hypothetical protein [Phytoactinopolyspora halophila]
MSDPGQLLLDALEAIKANPDRHKQDEYRCKTGMCLAGWMAEVAEDVTWVYPLDTSPAHLLPLLKDENSHMQHVEEWASRKIGWIAPHLVRFPPFAHDATVPQIEAGVHAFLEGATRHEIKKTMEAAVGSMV